MNKICRFLASVVIALAVISPMIGDVDARSNRLDEDAALNLLVRTLTHDRVYTNRISLDCITYLTEEKTAAYFVFVLRENHTADCGGDSDTNPVVDRYRVYRGSAKIELYDAAKDSWQRYSPAKTK